MMAFFHESRGSPASNETFSKSVRIRINGDGDFSSPASSFIKLDETPSIPGDLSLSVCWIVLSTSCHETGPMSSDHTEAEIFFASRLYISDHHLGSFRGGGLRGENFRLYSEGMSSRVISSFSLKRIGALQFVCQKRVPSRKYRSLTCSGSVSRAPLDGSIA